MQPTADIQQVAGSGVGLGCSSSSTESEAARVQEGLVVGPALVVGGDEVAAL
jgi:hypothetical protein